MFWNSEGATSSSRTTGGGGGGGDDGLGAPSRPVGFSAMTATSPAGIVETASSTAPAELVVEGDTVRDEAEVGADWFGWEEEEGAGAGAGAGVGAAT